MQSLSDDLSRRRRWRNLISEENINSNEMFFHAWKTLFAICSPRSDSIMSWRDIHWHFPRHNPWLGAEAHSSASRLQICCYTSHCSGLIRSLDLNLWPGVRQGQGQGRRGWDRWRSLRRSSLPSNIPTDITTLELINFYIDTSGKPRVQLSYRLKRVWIVDTALRMLRCRNLELLKTLLPSLACQ